MLKLIDLLVTAISDPVYFGAYPLPTQKTTRKTYYENLIKRIQH